jgi:hypothetical protein
MSRSLERLLDSAEKTFAQAPLQPRLQFVWQDADDTPETIQAKIRDLVASGHAEEGDQFVSFGWKPPENEAAGS